MNPIKVMMVSSKFSKPEIVYVKPEPAEYSKLLKHKGVILSLVMPQYLSTPGELMCCVNDAQLIGLSSNKYIETYDSIVQIFGPFLLSGFVSGTQISLPEHRIDYWMNKFQSINN